LEVRASGLGFVVVASENPSIELLNSESCCTAYAPLAVILLLTQTRCAATRVAVVEEPKQTGGSAMNDVVVLTDDELDSVAGGLGLIIRFGTEYGVTRMLESTWQARWDGPIGQISGVIDGA
jgi:hypothetical protein